ncbi:MAG: tetratricopeptide repeat protein [Anaerolineae bacterium]|nr:tetratricopeptide repeat protein [Anaerolineae bacterium]
MSARIDALNALAWELVHTDPQRSQALCEETRQLAAQDPAAYANGLGSSLLTLSIIEWEVSHFQVALSLALEALARFQEAGNLARQAFTLNHTAGIYFSLGNYAQAYELGIQALRLCETTGDTGLEASILNDTAYVSLHLKNFPDALPKLFKALHIHQESGNRRGAAYALDSIGRAYYLMGDYPKALAYGQQSLMCSHAINDPRSEAEALLHLGEAYAASNDEIQALGHFERALALCETNRYRQFETATLLAIGKLYLRQHSYDQALHYLTAALQVAQEIGAKQTIYEAHQLLADIYKGVGDFQQALAHYEQFHAVKEAVFNERSDNRIRSLQVAHDIETARKEAEIYQLRNVELQQEVHEREQLIAELNAFAHTVAHDIKSPVAIVVGFGEILLDQLKAMDDPDSIEMAESMMRTGYKITRIVDNLLTLASVREQEIIARPLDMAQIVAEVETRLRQPLAEFNAQLIAPESWPAALGHASWVEEVWANYIANAAKYGGKPPRIELGATPEGDMIRFWVRDNGIGFTPEAKDGLFTAFTRVAPQQIAGYGLGLSIVKRIVEKLGGTVDALSAGEGQGSLFSFTLPAVR